MNKKKYMYEIRLASGLTVQSGEELELYSLMADDLN